MNENTTVAVVGLGYVGLPLALAFGKHFHTIGFDLSEKKLSAYRDGVDPNGEMLSAAFRAANKITYTNNAEKLNEADFIVVAVPTPIDNAKLPDLTLLKEASKSIGKNLKRGAIVIFESTVYPGVTEEVCGKVLEEVSGLTAGKDFKLGYSPERINPGDKEHTLDKIIKVVSGQDEATLNKVAELYGKVVPAGIYKASSIKVAEAAKVIENTQRDLNIALMNELSLIFNKLNIDTHEVLQAAKTKWNFLPFTPGLVGGHCIGVDPYYLTHKAEMLGYHPEVILAGRRINDNMGNYIAQETVKKMIACGRPVRDASVLIMGLTFKENCSDLRNSKVVDIVSELKTFGINAMVWDPIAHSHEAKEEYGIELANLNQVKHLDAVIAAVAHNEIKNFDLNQLQQKCQKNTPFIDIKAIFDRKRLTDLGFAVWRL